MFTTLPFKKTFARRGLRLGLSVLAIGLAFALLAGVAAAAPSGSYLYWAQRTSPTTGAIGRAPVLGSPVEASFIPISPFSANGPVEPAVTSEYIYWPDATSESIGRVGVEGGTPEPEFITGVGEVFGVAVAGERIYWASEGKIGRADLDGSSVDLELISTAGEASGIAVAGEHIYWSNGKSIGRANLDGSGAEPDFITGAGEAWGVAVDGEHIYWANRTDHAIGRANLDGSEASQGFIQLAEPAKPSGLAFDGHHLYWSDSEAGTIGRAEIGGGSPEPEFITGAGKPFGLTIVAQAAPTLTTAAVESVAFGSSIYDTATLEGGASPTGQITFSAYGPGDESCTGTAAFTEAVTVSGNGSYPSPDFTPAGPGTYTWTAAYSGDDDNEPAVSACAESGETSTVTKAPTTLTTSAVASATLGTTIGDTATLGGGVTPTGTITFSAYGPNDPTCAGAAVFDEDVTVGEVGTFPSPDFTPTATGTYTWTASYSGDADNEASSSACGAAGETSTVTKAAATLGNVAVERVSLGGKIWDLAVLQGVDPAGEVTFGAYGPGDPTCTGTPVFTDTITVSGTANYKSEEFTPTAAGAYTWAVSYTGDENNEPVTSACGSPPNGTSTVTKLATGLTTTAVEAVAFGSPIHDTATLTGGASATGQITFSAYGPGDPTCAGTPAFTEAVTVAGDGSYSSPDFAPIEAGAYLWTADYSGDGNNEASSSACGATGEGSTVAPGVPPAEPQPSRNESPPSQPQGQSPGPGPGPSPSAASAPAPAKPRGLKALRTGSGKKAGYSLRFASATPGVTFTCRMDRGKFVACRSPRVYRGLAAGRHVFEVRAVSAEGLASPVAKLTFRVGKEGGRK